MKYLLLKNGRIAYDGMLLTGNMLIGNNRIIEIGTDVKQPNPYTEVIDMSNKYLLPGLIHFNCSFLKGENYKPANSAIYIAISHGATFLIDSVKLQKDTDCNRNIRQARESIKPIIADYGFHIRAYSCNRVTSQDLISIILTEGISSFFINWKDINKIEKDNLEQLFKLAAKFHLLIICESTAKDQSGNEIDYLISDKDSENFNILLSIIKKYNCKILFSGISSWKELELLYSKKELNENIYASVNLNNNRNDINKLISKDLAELLKNPNIILSPPELILPNSQKSHFIENDKSYSFLFDLICDKKGVNEELLVKTYELYATRPAKLLGIYPQKGVLEFGADADIIVWNPDDPHIMKSRSTNTFLLRKDINTLFINGKMITDEVYEMPYNLEGRFIYRNPII